MKNFEISFKNLLFVLTILLAIFCGYYFVTPEDREIPYVKDTYEDFEQPIIKHRLYSIPIN